MPVMCHIDHPPPSYEEVLGMLRPGDVLTHAFRPFPNAPCTVQGTVKPAVLEARKRGVLFDIGHGKGSFSFKTTRAMLANGFYPDTISSDVHVLCIDGPAYDQVTTMSKFLVLGMPLDGGDPRLDLQRGTFALKRPELGSLEAGRGGRCHDPVDQGGQVRLRGRDRRAHDRRQEDHRRGHGDRRQVVASQALAEVRAHRRQGEGDRVMTPEEKLKSMGLELPKVPTPMGNYVPYKIDGRTIYLAGQGPRRPDGSSISGRVGEDVTMEQAYELARGVGLSLLAVAKTAAGDLGKVEVLKVLGMVNAVPGFGDQPKVMNGCSDLFVAVLGERGRHARSAVGMGGLPANIPVEIEAIMRIVD